MIRSPDKAEKRERERETGKDKDKDKDKDKRDIRKRREELLLPMPSVYAIASLLVFNNLARDNWTQSLCLLLSPLCSLS